MPLSFLWQGHSSVPSCLLSCSLSPLEKTSLVAASWDRLPSLTQPQSLLSYSGSGPSIQLRTIFSPAKGPHHDLPSASVTQHSLMNAGKACCICLTRVLRWQTSPLRKIYQTEMRYITEFLQSKAVTSVSQSAECYLYQTLKPTRSHPLCLQTSRNIYCYNIFPHQPFNHLLWSLIKMKYCNTQATLARYWWILADVTIRKIAP